MGIKKINNPIFMYYKDDLLAKDIAELADIAKEFGADPNIGDKETLVYEILEKQASAEAAKNPLGTKRKRTRIVKKDTDHVYSVNGKEGENFDLKKNKVATQEQMPLFKDEALGAPNAPKAAAAQETNAQESGQKATSEPAVEEKAEEHMPTNNAISF